jgi:hypothetical protein
MSRDQPKCNLDWKEVRGEKSRTYHYGEGTSFTVDNVVKLCVRPSGNHRLETADGKKLIVAGGWLAIEINCEAWDF